MFIWHPQTNVATDKSNRIRIVSGGAYGTAETIANRSAFLPFGVRFVEHCDGSRSGW